MNISIVLRIFVLFLLLFAGCAGALAADVSCMKYVPAVDKNIAVPCEEFEASVPPAPAPPAPPPAASPPAVPATTTYEEDVAPLKKQLAEMTAALTEAKADTAFRETFCTLNATAQLLHQQKNQSEIKRLQNEHVALEAEVGERGRLVYTALQKEIMELVLGTPVDDAVPSTQLEATTEGQAFVKARDGLHLTCNCMYESVPPKRMFCCDACSKEALQARF